MISRYLDTVHVSQRIQVPIAICFLGEEGQVVKRHMGVLLHDRLRAPCKQAWEREIIDARLTLKISGASEEQSAIPGTRGALHLSSEGQDAVIARLDGLHCGRRS